MAQASGAPAHLRTSRGTAAASRPGERSPDRPRSPSVTLPRVKTIVQRVHKAAVRVDGETVGSIDDGLVAFVGVEVGDEPVDAHMTARKLAGLRIFPSAGDDGEDKPMDRCVLDTGGGVLVISQFTLAGKVAKGRRPSFSRAEHPDRAEPLYLEVVRELEARGIRVAKGRFGAHMDIEMVHDGPVTLRVETEGGVIVS